jgi:DNA replication protein DnaC
MEGSHPSLSKLRDSIYTFCAGYANNPRRGKTVVIFGENGSGKTRTLKLVSQWAKAIAIKLPLVNREDMDNRAGLPWSHFEHWPDTLSKFKSLGDLSGVQDLIQCNLAIIDDIGAGHDPSGFANEQLYLVLCRREFRWNIISTNYPPDKWDTKFERRIASRLFRNAEHIDLSGVPDYSTR